MYTIKNLTKTQLNYIKNAVNADHVYKKWNPTLAELRLVVAHADGWTDFVTFNDYDHCYEADHIYDGVSDPIVSSDTIIGAIKSTETPDQSPRTEINHYSIADSFSGAFYFKLI